MLDGQFCEAGIGNLSSFRKGKLRSKAPMTYLKGVKVSGILRNSPEYSNPHFAGLPALSQNLKLECNLTCILWIWVRERKHFTPWEVRNWCLRVSELYIILPSPVEKGILWATNFPLLPTFWRTLFISLTLSESVSSFHPLLLIWHSLFNNGGLF